MPTHHCGYCPAAAELRAARTTPGVWEASKRPRHHFPNPAVALSRAPRLGRFTDAANRQIVRTAQYCPKLRQQCAPLPPLESLFEA